jgi:hypothetical protein
MSFSSEFANMENAKQAIKNASERLQKMKLILVLNHPCLNSSPIKLGVMKNKTQYRRIDRYRTF